MIYALRLIHILAGAFWYGALIFLTRFLMPSLRSVGPASGQVMAQLNQRRLTPAMMGAAILNVGSGIWLMFITSGGDMGAWMRTGMGRTLGFGGGLAIIAMIVGMTMNPPAIKRLAAIGAAAAKRGGPPTPEEAAEITRLQKRLALGSIIPAILLTITVSAMAVARYM